MVLRRFSTNSPKPSADQCLIPRKVGAFLVACQVGAYGNSLSPAMRIGSSGCLGHNGPRCGEEGAMRKILAGLLYCWCGTALAQSAQELIDNGKNSENVTTF